MKATKAYIASLGTTGVLVTLSLLLLLVVSTLVAFRGWPGDGIADRIESVFVDETPSVRLSGPAQVAADAAPAAAAVAATPAPGAAAPGGAGLGPAPSTTPPRLPTRLQVAAPPTLPVPPVPGVAGGDDGDDPPGGGVRDTLADRTRQSTGQVGGGVNGLSPGLGGTVTDTGQALSDIIRGLPDTPSLPSAGAR